MLNHSKVIWNSQKYGFEFICGEILFTTCANFLKQTLSAIYNWKFKSAMRIQDSYLFLGHFPSPNQIICNKLLNWRCYLLFTFMWIRKKFWICNLYSNNGHFMHFMGIFRFSFCSCTFMIFVNTSTITCTAKLINWFSDNYCIISHLFTPKLQTTFADHYGFLKYSLNTFAKIRTGNFALN